MKNLKWKIVKYLTLEVFFWNLSFYSFCRPISSKHFIFIHLENKAKLLVSRGIEKGIGLKWVKILTDLIPVFHFYIPWKDWKTSGFLIEVGGIKIENCETEWKFSPITDVLYAILQKLHPNDCLLLLLVKWSSSESY